MDRRVTDFALFRFQPLLILVGVTIGLFFFFVFVRFAVRLTFLGQFRSWNEKKEIEGIQREKLTSRRFLDCFLGLLLFQTFLRTRRSRSSVEEGEMTARGYSPFLAATRDFLLGGF